MQFILDEQSEIGILKSHLTNYKRWTLATAASNVGRCHYCRPTPAGGRQHATFEKECILAIWMQCRCRNAAKWVHDTQG